jgi:Protein of unknown function (DUF3667)
MFSAVNDPPRPLPGTCANCGQPLTGPYCVGCGEKALRPEAMTVAYFIRHTVADELLHLDGKVWRTLRSLLFRPGSLPAEYSAGRRRAYVNPLRLLIIGIIVYALATQGGLFVTLTIAQLHLSVAPARVAHETSVAEAVRRVDRFGVLQRAFGAKIQSADGGSEMVREHFHRRLNEFVEPLSFANVLLLAVALYALFRRRRTLFLQHLVFSMHFVTFVLLSSLVLLPGAWLISRNRGAGAAAAVGLAVLLIVTIWQFAYLTVALRRFYALTALVSVAAAIFIYLLNSAFVTVVQMVGVAIALRAV